MSHVTDVGMRVSEDLDLLERVGAKRGLVLDRGRTRYNWYGSWQDDFHGRFAAVDQGFRPQDFGKCEHVLRRADARPGDYEIGVVRSPDGVGYQLLYDAYGSGAKLEQVAGHHLEDLQRDYTVALATQRAHEQLMAEGFEECEAEELQDGRIKLRWTRQ